MKLVSILFLLIDISGFSQNISPDKYGQQKPFIEVVGTAVREVKPDQIDLSITLSERNNANSENTIDWQDKNLKNILSEMSIPGLQLTLADISSEIIKEKKKDPSVQRTKEYNLRLFSADQVSLLLQKLSDANIKEVKILRIGHSKIDSLRKEVRIAAIKATKDKAIYLTTAIGEKIDQALEIREELAELPFQRYPQNTMANSSLVPGVEQAGESGTNFKMFKIKCSYYIKYSLKQMLSN